ncbi:SDR family oxidoreductase [Actinosynnema sp. NPDC050436]|uniref:SDR family oxidoreductase n=1 Tax=Actinosynnema sp. NPDC050436 TaxID=3155659 RepID=UPI0033D34C49
MPAPRRTILLTGASGVVGQALLPRLTGHRVVSLVHNTVPAGAGEHVRGDLTAPGLGLDPDRAHRLADEVDAIVHCAAVTDFTATADATHELNVLGTRRVLEFAERSGAVVHYVSTAFVARTDLAREDVREGMTDPSAYLETKRAAEQVVTGAGLPATIIRPSVVVGDSATGAIAKFQGLHTLIRAVLRGSLPLVPLRPGARVDFVPQDVLADAVANLVDAGVTSGDYWITAGEAALTTSAMIELCVRAGARHGVRAEPPRLVEPDMVERLIRPVFIDPLPRAVRRRFDDMIAMTALFANAAAFPSTLGDVPGCRPLTTRDLTTAFTNGVEYLVHAQRLARPTDGTPPRGEGAEDAA